MNIQKGKADEEFHFKSKAC